MSMCDARLCYAGRHGIGGTNPASLGGSYAEVVSQERQEKVFSPEKGALVCTVFYRERRASAKVQGVGRRGEGARRIW